MSSKWYIKKKKKIKKQHIIILFIKFRVAWYSENHSPKWVEKCTCCRKNSLVKAEKSWVYLYPIIPITFCFTLDDVTFGKILSVEFLVLRQLSRMAHFTFVFSDSMCVCNIHLKWTWFLNKNCVITRNLITISFYAERLPFSDQCELKALQFI